MLRLWHARPRSHGVSPPASSPIELLVHLSPVVVFKLASVGAGDLPPTVSSGENVNEMVEGVLASAHSLAAHARLLSTSSLYVPTLEPRPSSVPDLPPSQRGGARARAEAIGNPGECVKVADDADSSVLSPFSPSCVTDMNGSGDGATTPLSNIVDTCPGSDVAGECAPCPTLPDPVDQDATTIYLADTNCKQHASLYIDGHLSSSSSSSPVPTRFLIDTGASVSLIDASLLDSLHARSSLYPAKSLGITRVVAANGQALSLLGAVDLSVQFKQDQPALTVSVLVSTLNPQCLLGADFLLRYGMTLDLGTLMLSGSGVNVPLSVPHAPPPPSDDFSVALCQTVTLPAHHEVVTTARLRLKPSRSDCPPPQCDFSSLGQGIVELVPSVFERYGVLGACVLSTPHADGTVPLRLMNNTSSSIRLRRHTTVGTWQGILSASEDINFDDEDDTAPAHDVHSATADSSNLASDLFD